MFLFETDWVYNMFGYLLYCGFQNAICEINGLTIFAQKKGTTTSRPGEPQNQSSSRGAVFRLEALLKGKINEYVLEIFRLKHSIGIHRQCSDGTQKGDEHHEKKHRP